MSELTIYDTPQEERDFIEGFNSELNEALENVEYEACPEDLLIIKKRLEYFKQYINTMKLVAVFMEDDERIEFYSNEDGPLLAYSCGDDSDSNSYIPYFCLNTEELKQIHERYKTVISNKTIEPNSLWGSLFNYEDNFERWEYVFPNGFPEFINIPSLYFGTNPMTGKGQQPFQSPYLYQGRAE